MRREAGSRRLPAPSHKVWLAMATLLGSCLTPSLTASRVGSPDMYAQSCVRPDAPRRCRQLLDGQGGPSCCLPAGQHAPAPTGRTSGRRRRLPASAQLVEEEQKKEEASKRNERRAAERPMEKRVRRRSSFWGNGAGARSFTSRSSRPSMLLFLGGGAAAHLKQFQ